mgnify:CR=1 FL=1
MNNDLRPYMPTHPGEVRITGKGNQPKEIFFIDRCFLYNAE